MGSYWDNFGPLSNLRATLNLLPQTSPQKRRLVNEEHKDGVMLTRRQLLKAGAIGGAAMLVPGVGRSVLLPDAEEGHHNQAAAAGGHKPLNIMPSSSLDPTTLPKYVTPLVIPPAMPKTGTRSRTASIDYYEIAVRQFHQQILPLGHAHDDGLELRLGQRHPARSTTPPSPSRRRSTGRCG